MAEHKQPVKKPPVCPHCGYELDHPADGMWYCSECGFEQKGK